MKKLRGKLAAAIRPVKRLSVSEWAERYFRLPSTSAEPGRLKLDRTPYVRAIMDAFTQDEVHKVVVKSAAQAGKSTVLLAVVGRFVHLDPCNIMLVAPTLEMAQDFSKDRLERMIEDCPVLPPLFKDIGKTRNSSQTILSKFFTGGRIVLQGANSPAGLASRPIRILLCDEVDRFPVSAGNEGDAVSLAEKRQTTYWNYKTGLFSTPTIEEVSRIDKEYKLGTCERWMHQCPNCGEYHFLDYREMVTDYEEKIDEYKNKTIVVNSVKWRCPDCGMEFSELTMKNTRQEYIAENSEAIKNGVRSFWINGFSSTFLSWSVIMREYLEAKGDYVKEQVVYNTRFGVSYRQRGEIKDEGELLKRRENYGAELPEEVVLLTAGVDVQANRLEYEICGFSADEQCYGIKRGTVWGVATRQSTWQQLDAVLNADYKFGDGRVLKVARTFVDSGYNTDAVYQYCESRQQRGVFPIKGKGGAGLPILYQYGKPKNARVILVILGVDTIKSEVMSRLSLEVGSALSFHYPVEDEIERGYDQIYFRELISERLVPRRSGGNIQLVWEKITQGSRNESLDVRGYALAAMKSCIGNREAAEFWREQTAALRSEVITEKKPNRVQSRTFDIWN